MSDHEQPADLVRADEADVAVSATPPPLGLARQIGRGAVAVAGVGLVLMPGLVILGWLLQVFFFNDTATTEIYTLITSIGSMIGGVSMLRRGRRGNGPADSELRELGGAPVSAVPVEQLLLAVASAHGGRVTAAEVAAAMTIDPMYALRMLDEATQAGEARVLFSPEGIAVYEFAGLLASKADAREPWQL